MPQVPVASTDTYTDGQHSRVTYYEEQDIQPATDQELAELCRQTDRERDHITDDITLQELAAYGREQGISTVCMQPHEVDALIDSLRASRERVFM